jgi:hypothetical protein
MQQCPFHKVPDSLVELMTVRAVMVSGSGYDDGPVDASGWRFSEVLDRSDGAEVVEYETIMNQTVALAA